MDWLEIILRLGFPAAVCIALMWWINQRDKLESQRRQERESRMANRLDTLQDEVLAITRTVISDNTDAMRRMTHAIVEMRDHCSQR